MYNPTICMIEADGQKFKVIFDPLWLPNNFEANLDNLFLKEKKNTTFKIIWSSNSTNTFGMIFSGFHHIEIANRLQPT